MKLLTSFFFIILFMTSCQLENNKTIVEAKKKITKVEEKIIKVEKKIVEVVNVNKLKVKKQKNTKSVFYLVGVCCSVGVQGALRLSNKTQAPDLHQPLPLPLPLPLHLCPCCGKEWFSQFSAPNISKSKQPTVNCFIPPGLKYVSCGYKYEYEYTVRVY